MDHVLLRRASARILGNEKAVEVIRALRDASGTATAQQLAKSTSIDHSMVRDVLIKLADGGVLATLPRATSRAAQYYEADPADQVWVALARLADALFEAHTAVQEPGAIANADGR